MSDKKHPQGIDPRLHSYLDGESTPSESAAFEGDLRAGKTLRNRLETLRHIEEWFQATRPRAPSNIADAVERAILAGRSLEERSTAPSRSRIPHRDRHAGSSWWDRIISASKIRQAWVPAAAAVAVLAIVLAIPQVRELVRPDGVSPPSERAITERVSAEDAAPPAEDQDPGRSEALLRAQESPGARNTALSTSENKIRYEFTVEAGGASEVCLAGDFNRWTVCEARLIRVGEDVWSISLDLPPGRYEYMFVVDGRWVTDPSADLHADDGFGNRNAVLII